MADIASLQVKIDSTQAKTAVDDLNRLGKAGSDAEGKVNSAGKTWVRASSDAAKLRMSGKEAADALDELGRAARTAEASTVRIGSAAQKAGANMDVVTTAAGAQRAGMQQLGYQLGDIATMWASGARPATIFATQIGQVTQAVTLLSGGTSMLARFLGGPWGIAISTAAIALSPFIAKLFESEGAANKAADGYRNAAAEARSLAGAMNALDLVDRQIKLNKSRDRMLELENRIASRPKGPDGTPMFSYKDQRELLGLRQEILKEANIVKLAEEQTEKLERAKDKVAKTSERQASGHRAAAKTISEEQRAYEQQVKSTNQFIASLEEEVSKIGLDEKAVRQLTIQREIDAAKTEKQKNRIRELNVEREKGLAAEAAKKSQESFDKRIKALDDEYRLIGLVGPAREMAALMLEKEAFMAEYSALGVDKAAEAWEKYVAAKSKNISKEAEIKAEAEATERLNDELRNTISILQQIGGFAGVLGDILGFVSGNYGSIGGKFGSILDASILRKDKETGKYVATKIGDELKGVFGKGGIFSEGMTAALQNAGIGAAVGSAVDGVMDKLGIKSSNTGAQIGGAAGMVVAGPIGAIAGSILGGLVGGLFKSTKKGVATFTGTGSDFDIVNRGNSDKRIAAANEAADSIITAMKDIADKLNGTVDAALASVSIGIRNKKWVVDTTGQGRTKGSGVLKFDTEEEAISAAIQDMINDGVIKGIRESTMRLLKAGGDLEANLQKALDFENVFRSLEQSTNPLKAALDQIQKEFEYLTEVFKEAGATAAEYAQLQEYIDKQRAAAIDSASANYRANFYTDAENEAYAKSQIETQMTALGYPDVDTVAEYKKLVESIDTSTDEGLEKYGALMELSDEFATLQQAQQARAEEAAQKAAEAQQIANQKKAMEVELLRLQGKEEEALAKERQLALDGLDSSLRSLQQQIFKYQDIADAKDVLAQAYERESSALQETIDKFKAFSGTLRDFRDSLYASDTSTSSYNARLAKLMQVGGLAGAGDETALGQLPGVGKDFLDVARNRAGSMLEYQRSVALVAQYTDQAIAAADGQMSVAEKQLAEMKTQVGALIDINESVISVQEAIERLNALLAPGNGTGTTTTPTVPRFNIGGLIDQFRGVTSVDELRRIIFEGLGEQFAGLRSDVQVGNRNSERTAKLLDRAMQDGTSLNVTVAS